MRVPCVRAFLARAQIVKHMLPLCDSAILSSGKAGRQLASKFGGAFDFMTESVPSAMGEVYSNSFALNALTLGFFQSNMIGLLQALLPFSAEKSNIVNTIKVPI